MMKNILCFGDSNTFGSNPAGGRHPRYVRWTGRLQELLGEEFYVIEEGMGGRNTVWDDPLEPLRNGLAVLPVCLQSHQPLDMVIISLGTNDCKSIFHASPRVIAAGVDAICCAVERFPYRDGGPAPKLLIVSPIHISEDIENSTFVSYDQSSADKSRELAPFYKKVAEQHGTLFLDASQVASASDLDKLHLDGEGHRAMAEALYSLIRSACLDSAGFCAG